MLNTERSTIINPVNENRATKLFGGKFSGILNWNDLLHPDIYTKREDIRAGFWGVDEMELGLIQNQIVTDAQKDQMDKINKVIDILQHAHVYYVMSVDVILEYATDPSVVSVCSTIKDQTNEGFLGMSEIKRNSNTVTKNESYYDAISNKMISDLFIHDHVKDPLRVYLRILDALSIYAGAFGVSLGKLFDVSYEINNIPQLRLTIDNITRDFKKAGEFFELINGYIEEEHKQELSFMSPPDKHPLPKKNSILYYISELMNVEFLEDKPEEEIEDKKSASVSSLDPDWDDL